MGALDPARAYKELQQLAALTSDEGGAQRLAWTGVWQRARDWLCTELDAIGGVERHVDAAGNIWATLPGEREDAVVLGGHLDSVADGGWLDGALNVLAALEVLRSLAAEGTPPMTVRLVDWADEEGSRFGRSLLGSSACSGTLEPDLVRGLTDRDGVVLADALAAYDVDVDRMLEAQSERAAVRAYLELHIEQGPVLERMGEPLGVVLGTFGVQRHAIRFTGAHAHAGSTPMDARRDAFMAAAASALAIREDALAREDVRATVGSVSVAPGIVTAFNGSCELSLDQRALERGVLQEMLGAARAATERIAADEGCSVEWRSLLELDPIPFSEELADLGAGVLDELTGSAPRMWSGPLHDAAEMARVLPATMLFVRSLGGVSHTKEEDSSREDIELSVRALAALTARTIDHFESKNA